MTPSASFCVLPWMHVFADERGIIYPCCRSVGTQLPNTDAQTGKPYKIFEKESLQKAWNSRYMLDIRSDMLAGRRPEPCERCYFYEDLGIPSHRQSQNRQYAGSIPELLQNTDSKGALPVNLRSVDLRLGNRCNLRCRMCSPQSSKALINEWAAFHDVPHHHPFFNELRSLDWFAQDAFWEMFETYAHNLERIHFAGGEPFLIPRMFDFLERLIRLELAPRITVSYNTNLTLLPQRVFDLWPQFKGIRITISLDGFAKVNSFIRHPSKWQTIHRHLHLLDTNFERLNCTVGIGINSTVQVHNIFRLGELIDYLATGFDHVEAPNLSILSYPEHFGIQILPPEMKEQAASQLINFMQHKQYWPLHWQGPPLEKLFQSLNGIVAHMMETDRTHLIPEFQRWNRHQDRYRKQQTGMIVPELAPLIQFNQLET